MRKFFKECSESRMAPLANQNGVTYLFVMILVVVMSIATLEVTQPWSVIMQRDREAELQFRGNSIAKAIERFVADWEIQKATRPNQWPRTLEELTKKSPKRYLRKAYADPITGNKFALIKIGQEIHGVRSTSTETPYNQDIFKGAKTYQAIRFEAKGSTNCQVNPLNPNAPTNCAPAANTLPSGETSLGDTSSTNSPVQAPSTEAPAKETPTFQ
jgi:Tfp pilus assembly protein PilE